MRLRLLAALVALAAAASAQQPPPEKARPRVREAGIVVGTLPPGPLNAISDVSGVLVGHATLIRGDNVRSGVTAILPHGGNLFREKVPAAVFVGNAFGKLMGSTQIEELGELETPILLTSTLNVPRVADALLDYMLALPGNEDVRSVNAVVGETNDGFLNDIRSRPVGREEVLAAIRGAKSGLVEEGSVGAGTGTVAFGWKGGIGTASRRLPSNLGGYTVGVLVQTNFGGALTIAGAPVGQELQPSAIGRRSSAAPVFANDQRPTTNDGFSGSCMIVVATDAPLDARNLRRLAARAIHGMARTGASGDNGSGDYVISFSTAPELRLRHGETGVRQARALSNNSVSPFFLAAIEATEEAIYNSLFRATTVMGRGHTVEALPLDKTIEILRRHGVIRQGTK